MSNKAIGGFFGLETNGCTADFHPNAYGLSNGRSCFNLILLHTKPSRVYVPFYSCDTLLQPLVENNIEYTFYSINPQFEPVDLPELSATELIVYINYFGLKDNFAADLSRKYKQQLIIDNTQSYFSKGYPESWSFNSARKFFGVPDGAYLYTPYEIGTPFERNTNFSADHLILQLDGRQDEAYVAFQENELKQTSTPYSISTFSEKTLACIDYEKVADIRRKNFGYYHEHLQSQNEWDIETTSDAVPFCYPLLLKKPAVLTDFYKERIFIPRLWEDVILRGGVNFKAEKDLCKNLLPLPVDHRYSNEDIMLVINTIFKTID